MLAQSFSCGESEDRNLCLLVAEDHARHNGTGLNIDRGSDVRKYEVCHWDLPCCAPHRFHISMPVGSGCRWPVRSKTEVVQRLVRVAWAHPVASLAGAFA